MSKKVEAYACKTDWDLHVPEDYDGVTFYFSIDSLKQHRKCTQECGIVKVTLEYTSTEQEPNYAR